MKKKAKQIWPSVWRPILLIALVLFVLYAFLTYVFPWLKVTTIREQQNSYVSGIDNYIEKSEITFLMNNEWLNSINIQIHFAENVKKVPFVLYLPFYAPERTMKYDKDSAMIASKTFDDNTMLTIFPRTTANELSLDFENRDGDLGRQLINRDNFEDSISVNVNITSPIYNSWLDNSALVLSSFTRIILDIPGEHHYYSKPDSDFADTLSYGNSYVLDNRDGKFSMRYVIGNQYVDKGRPHLTWENMRKLFSEAFFGLFLDILLLVVTFLISGYDSIRTVKYRIASIAIALVWAIMLTFYFVFDDPNKGIVASIFCLFATILYIVRWFVSRSKSAPQTVARH